MHAAYDRVFQTPSFENILLASSPDVVVLNPNVLRLPVEPSHGNYYEAGMTKGFMGKLSLDVNGYFRDVNNFADDDLLLNTPVSFPIAFRKAQIYGAEGKVNIPRLGQSVRIRQLFLHGGIGLLSGHRRPLSRAVGDQCADATERAFLGLAGPAKHGADALSLSVPASACGARSARNTAAGCRLISTARMKRRWHNTVRRSSIA